MFIYTDIDNQCVIKKMRKKCSDIWWVRIKAVILQPFSRLAQARATKRLEDGNADKHWKSASYKENAEKMTENLVSPNKSSNFAAAFEKTRPLGVENKKAPQSGLWKIEAIDVVQESTPYYIGLLKGKKFPSSTLNRLDILSRVIIIFTTKSLILAQDER